MKLNQAYDLVKQSQYVEAVKMIAEAEAAAKDGLVTEPMTEAEAVEAAEAEAEDEELETD